MACCAVVIGVVNKTVLRLWGLPNDLKHNEASFLMISTDMLYLSVAQVHRCPDLAIFVLTDDDRQTQPIRLPLAHACRVITGVQQ